MKREKLFVTNKRHLKIKIPTSIFVLIIVITVSIISILANVIRDKNIILKNKAEIVSKEMNGGEKLDLQSALIKELYNKVFDKRDFEIGSLIYPNLDKIIIKEMDINSKMKLVMGNMESKAFANSDCESNKEKTVNYNNESFTCLMGEGNYILLDKVQNKYLELYGSLDGFIKDSIIDTNLNEIYVYGINANGVEGYYKYKSGGRGSLLYSNTRKLVDAVLVDNVISITENIVNIDAVGTKYEENVTYTFKKEKNLSYTYYSRIRNKL